MVLADRIQIRSNNINVLKFICAVLVIYSHSFAVAQNQMDPLAKLTHNQCNIGGVAVAVFFFLSGLYVTKSGERETSITVFLKKRCRRIFPQLWMVVLICIFLVGPILTTLSLSDYFTSKDTYMYFLNMLLIPVHNLPGVFGNNLYQTVNGPLWTMPVEFAAYIGLAIIMLFERKSGSLKEKGVLDTLALLFLFVIFIIAQFYLKNEMLVSVARALILFFEGVWFYRNKEKIRLNIGIGVLAFGILIISTMTPFFNLFLIALFPYVIVSICLGMRQISMIPKFVESSYEMYLFGWPIQQIILVLFHSSMKAELNFAITIPIDILLGTCLLLAVSKIEKQFLKK